jgi:uncharacterized protein YdeI (YjbR/CyaY-like superfamily)
MLSTGRIEHGRAHVKHAFRATSGGKSVADEDAIREALCFGWIDSPVKRLDGDRYLLKLTPRDRAARRRKDARTEVGQCARGRSFASMTPFHHPW